jgi:spoIIIJ-associated protein
MKINKNMDDEKIQNFIKEFVEKMKINVESVEVLTVVGHKIFNINTTDSKMLIGPRGEHLRSLNYIIRKIFEKNNDKSERFMIDINGYQQKHIKEIEQKATLLAERVRTFKSSASMAPMTSYERMLVHSMFSDDEQISTESEGFGRNRHIVLKYND